MYDVGLLLSYWMFSVGGRIARNKQIRHTTPESIASADLAFIIRQLGDKDLLKEKLEAAEKDLMPFMVLPLTKEIAMESAKIQATLERWGRTIGINDVYIAATAMVNKASLVTRNDSHFDQVEGLLVEKY